VDQVVDALCPPTLMAEVETEDGWLLSVLSQGSLPDQRCTALSTSVLQYQVLVSISNFIYQ